MTQLAHLNEKDVPQKHNMQLQK